MAAQFEPSTVFWFHAVNTVEAWEQATHRMDMVLSESAAAAPPCFGVECDIRFRLLDNASSTFASVTDNSSASPPSTLLLAHDPIPSTSTIVSVDLSAPDSHVVINGIRHLTLDGLVERLAAFKKGRQNVTGLSFVLKLDVKDLSALPDLLAMLKGIERPSARGQPCQPTHNEQTFYRDAVFVELGIPRCLVWLNMDVVPFRPPSAIADATLAAASDVATLALPFFGLAVHELGLGLSLGWQISPSIGPWMRDVANPPTQHDLEKCYADGNARMVSFIANIFSDSVKANANWATNQNRQYRLVTFALNYALFIGKPVALSALSELTTETRAIISKGGYNTPIIFPTYWRSRDTALTDEGKERLTAECKSIGLQCSVDQE